MATSTKDATGRAREMLSAERSELMGQVSRIDRALEALQGGAKRKSSKRKRKATTGNGRRRSRENRADAFVALVEQKPGITATEAARELGTAPNYLYRIGKQVVAKGLIAKREGSYFPLSQPIPAQSMAEQPSQEQQHDEAVEQDGAAA